MTKEFLLIGNIGDSSGYVIKNKKLHKVTKDHTLVNILVEKRQQKYFKNKLQEHNKNIIFKDIKDVKSECWKDDEFFLITSSHSEPILNRPIPYVSYTNKVDYYL